MLAWHFLPISKRLGYGDNRIVQAGKTYRIRSGNPVLCINGMHGNVKILDALKSAPGPIVCRVDITEDIMCGYDKIVGRSRKVLWMLDATNILHEFSCRCAEDVLTMIASPDPRSIAAVKAKRDWLAGKINDAELASAASAVRYAWWAAGDAWVASTASAAWAMAETKSRSKQNRRLTAMVYAAHRKEQ